MTLDMVTRTIGVIVAPVVMITACSLVLSGLLARYASVNDRLRTMGRERFELIRTRQSGGTAAGDRLMAERLDEVDTQIPDLLHHHRMLRNAVVAIYGALFVFIASMFIIAWAAVLTSATLATAALGVFLGGTGVLLAGVLQAVLEIRSSDHALNYEMQRVMRLGE